MKILRYLFQYAIWLVNLGRMTELYNKEPYTEQHQHQHQQQHQEQTMTATVR
jgi:hypothetical protein